MDVFPAVAAGADELHLAIATLREASSVVALTGAGISTDSGIRDFRGPNGLWTESPAARERMTLHAYESDAELRRSGWKSRGSAPAWSASPNAGHLALVDLERRGRLELVITQNADGLHKKAGHCEDRVLELHGSIHRTRCLTCSSITPTAEVIARVQAGDEDPRCLEIVEGSRCGGLLKVATVSFGQRLDEIELRRAVTAVRSCDVLLVVGSSLRVDPVAGLVPLAVSEGVAVVIVNAMETRYDHLADVVVRGSISNVLPVLVG